MRLITTVLTHFYQLSLNSKPAYCATGETDGGGLSGIFKIFVKLKSIGIKLWCACTKS